MSDEIGGVGCLEQIGGICCKVNYADCQNKVKIPFVCFNNNDVYYMLQYVYYM